MAPRAPWAAVTAAEAVDLLDPSYRPGLDSRGRPVVPADLLPPFPGGEVGVERIVIPVRPPAGPARLELELELPLGRAVR